MSARAACVRAHLRAAASLLLLAASAACADERPVRGAPVEPTDVEAPPVGSCRLRHAGALEFGTVGAGYAPELALELVNEGDAPCAIELGAASDARVQVLDRPASVAAGEALSVGVRFRPAGDGTALRAELPLVVEGEARAVSLTADVAARCVADVPPWLSLDACGESIRTFTFHNMCSHAIELEHIEVLHSDAFAVARAPILPARYEAGSEGRVAVGVASMRPIYEPGELRLAFSGELHDVRLGAPPAIGPQEEIHRTPSRRKVDVLYVVDDTPALAGSIEKLEESFVWLISMGLDARYAITTATLEGDESCPATGGLVVGPADEPWVPFAWTAFERIAALPFCSTAENRALEAAWRVLSADDGPAAGFRREGVPLAVVFVSLRDDGGTELPAAWVDRVQRLVGYRERDDVSVHVLAGPPGGCGGIDDAARLRAAAELAPRGRFVSACDESWEELVPVDIVFDYYGFGPFRIYPAKTPVDLDGDGAIRAGTDELAMWMNGAPRPAVSPRGAKVWDYSAKYGYVFFYTPYTPELDTEIVLRYQAWCE